MENSKRWIPSLSEKSGKFGGHFSKMFLIVRVEQMKLPPAESDCWLVSLSIVFTDWQQLPRVSDRSLSQAVLKMPGIETGAFCSASELQSFLLISCLFSPLIMRPHAVLEVLLLG